MAILPILHYPDPRLRVTARPVNRVNTQVRQLFDDMLETMYDAPGVGLAAPQVNVAQRLVVIDISEEKNAPLFLVNPKVTAKEGVEVYEEGCLSVPETYENVERAAKVTVTALDYQGEAVELTVEGLLAVCIQHEIDHLDGKLFVDYLSRIKQQRIRKKMLKMDKQEKNA